MSRAARRVPPTWEHPKDERGKYIPLLEGSFAEELTEWCEQALRWLQGEKALPHYDESTRKCRLVYEPIGDYAGSLYDWIGEPPRDEGWMPSWPEHERTHWQMYETTSEGTPLSPVMDSPEALARWLADSGASAFGKETASYEQWLGTILAGGSFSAAMDERGWHSGVEIMGDQYNREHAS